MWLLLLVNILNLREEVDLHLPIHLKECLQGFVSPCIMLALLEVIKVCHLLPLEEEVSLKLVNEVVLGGDNSQRPIGGFFAPNAPSKHSSE